MQHGTRAVPWTQVILHDRSLFNGYSFCARRPAGASRTRSAFVRTESLESSVPRNDAAHLDSLLRMKCLFSFLYHTICLCMCVYVCMYVCMYDYIAVYTRTSTPPTTGTD